MVSPALIYSKVERSLPWEMIDFLVNLHGLEDIEGDHGSGPYEVPRGAVEVHLEQTVRVQQFADQLRPIVNYCQYS